MRHRGLWVPAITWYRGRCSPGHQVTGISRRAGAGAVPVGVRHRGLRADGRLEDQAAGAGHRGAWPTGRAGHRVCLERELPVEPVGVGVGLWLMSEPEPRCRRAGAGAGRRGAWNWSLAVKMVGVAVGH